MTPLSANLSVEAFCATRYAVANVLPDDLLPNARRTAALWEAILGLLGACVLTSGFRGKLLNERVGGSGSKKRPGKLSAHCLARAVDFVPVKIAPGAAVARIRDAFRVGLPVDKVILESNGRQVWVHAQVSELGVPPKGLALMTFDAVHFVPFDAADARVSQLVV